MTTFNVLFDAQKKRYELEKQIASGGEGSIHTVKGEPEWVVKHYHVSATRPDLASLAKQQTKITHMLANKPFIEQFEGDPEHAYWTWPSEQLVNEQGDFVAYLMPKINAIKGEEFLQFSSGFSWQKRLQACLDLARVVEATHEAGYIIGDLNPRNLFFTPFYLNDGTELVLPTVTDSDSFQVNDVSTGEILFPCTVQNPEYSAPELINAYTFDRTREQDYFTLGIVIFQLLSLGVHPFSGTVKGLANQEIKNNIAKGRNVLKPKELIPPKLMIDLGVFPPELLELFDQTFSLGHTVTRSRATTQDWQNVLTDLLGDRLLRCSRFEGHVFTDHLDDCPWCQYASRLGADPFHPALKEANTAARSAQARTPKVMDTPNVPTGSDFVQVSQGDAEAIRAEVGNNSFFGPIPDELMPGHEEDESAVRKKTKKQAKPLSPEKPRVGSGKWMGIVLLILVFALPIWWFGFTSSGKQVYAQTIQPTINSLRERLTGGLQPSGQGQTDSPSTVSATPQVAVPIATQNNTGNLSIRIEACIDADNQAPFDCNAVAQAFAGIQLSVQDSRSTILLSPTKEANKESYFAEQLSEGRYSIIFDDSRMLTDYRRCPSTSPLLNPGQNPFRFELRANTTILFVYCALVP